MPILDADGYPVDIEINGLGANYCFQLPAAIFDFEYFRMVFATVQGDERMIFFNLAG